MELSTLNGNIIGVISNNYKEDDFKDLLVKDIIVNKTKESLKMVKLDETILDKKFSDLSSNYQNKVILASKLHDKEIVLVNFSRGLLKKEISYFKSLFRKVVSYNRRIILIDKNAELFLNCVDRIYVINNDTVKYDTIDIFDKILELYIDPPQIVEFSNRCEKIGIRLDHYTELDELLKAIYRIKA